MARYIQLSPEARLRFTQGCIIPCPSIRLKMQAPEDALAQMNITNGTTEACPFCKIAESAEYNDPASIKTVNSEETGKFAPVVLSTEDVVAFLHPLPLTPGHLIVIPRKHRIKLGDLKPIESAEVRAARPAWIEAYESVLCLTDISKTTNTSRSSAYFPC